MAQIGFALFEALSIEAAGYRDATLKTLGWGIAVAGRRDSGKNSKAHHANYAYANPSWRYMQQMCPGRKPHNENDVTDHVHTE
jgi:hypothetical protein